MPDPTPPPVAPAPIEVPAGPPAPAATPAAAPVEAPKQNARQIADSLAERRRHAERARSEKQRADTAARERDAERQARSAAEARTKELEAQLARAKSDPLTLARELGGDVEVGVKRFIEADTPEGRVARLEEELKAERETRKKEAAERERANQEAQQQAALQKEREALLRFTQAVTSPDQQKAFPYLSLLFEPNEIYAQAVEVHNWAKSQGQAYSYQEVAAWLEKRAQAKYDGMSDRQKKLFGSAADPTRPADGVNETAAPAKDRRANERSNTRSNSTAPPVTKTKRQLRAEEEARDLAMIRQAQAADRKARAS